MPDFRIKYGFALGPLGGTIAYTNSITGVTLAESSTGADFTNNVVLLTSNTTTTVISNIFANRNAILGGQEEPPDGKIAIFMFQDSMTSVANARNVFLSSTMNTFTSGAVLGLIAVNSSWYEMFRSKNHSVGTNQSDVSAYSVGGTSVSFDVTNTRFLIVTATAASTILSFSGGDVGQIVYLVTPSGGNAVTIGSGGNLALAGTGDFVTNTSAVYTFVRPTGAARWLLSALGPR